MDREQVKAVGRHPVIGWIIAPIALSIIYWGYDANTVDDEVKPVVADHETRIGQQETVTVEIAENVRSNTVQTAFMGQKFASEDILRLEKKKDITPELFTADDANSLQNAKNRLNFTQGVLDRAMGMPSEEPGNN